MLESIGEADLTVERKFVGFTSPLGCYPGKGKGEELDLLKPQARGSSKATCPHS
jgi:hypothetical protein